MLSRLLGRITGADKKKQFPEQQGAALGRIGDYFVVCPYGLWADLPDDTLLVEICEGVAISATVDRPADVGRDEPVFYHPVTGSRIIMRKSGDIEVQGSSNLIANMTGSMTIAAVGAIDITAPAVTINGNLIINGTATNNGKDIGSTHVHAGSPSAPPGGVSNTGAPV